MIKVYNMSDIQSVEILKRDEKKCDVSKTVSEIIDNVRKRRDAALFDYTEKFDRVRLSSLVGLSIPNIFLAVEE